MNVCCLRTESVFLHLYFPSQEVELFLLRNVLITNRHLPEKSLKNEAVVHPLRNVTINKFLNSSNLIFPKDNTGG